MLPWQPKWQKMLSQAIHVQGRGNLYLVSDSHLGCRQSQVAPFIRMLSQLKQPDALILLGDIFHIWLASPRFWNDDIREVIKALEKLRRQGTSIWCLIGNRDHLMPRQPTSELPFDAITDNMLVVRWHETTYGFTHGNMIDRYNHSYLIFNYLTSSRFFRFIFGHLPKLLARKFAYQVYKNLASSDSSFKQYFPQQEIQAFAKWIPVHISHFIIGHFHATDTFKQRDTTLYLAPPWLEQQQIGKISQNKPPFFKVFKQ